MLSTEQKAVITATVPVLAAHGLAIIHHFYQRLFRHHPELKEIFNHANQVAGHQQEALASAVHAYAAHIDDVGVLAPALSRIAHKHAALGVRPEQYAVVGEHLLASLEEVLGGAATRPILEAWGAAFQILADALIAEEAALTAQAEAAAGGWRGLRAFVVERREVESERITSFYLRPHDGGAVTRHLPGQFITVSIFVPALGHRQLRHYSLSDAPDQGGYRISVKREERGGDARAASVSNLLHDHVGPGDVLELGPPFGPFHLDVGRTTPVVLISAGVGITPMMSMLQAAVQAQTRRQVLFVHGARNGRAHALRQHLDRVVRDQPQVQAIVFYSAPGALDRAGVDYHLMGRVDLARIREALLLPDADYYLCGPASFMTEQLAALAALGVAGARVHHERFAPEPSPA